MKLSPSARILATDVGVAGLIAAVMLALAPVTATAAVGLMLAFVAVRGGLVALRLGRVLAQGRPAPRHPARSGGAAARRRP